MSKNKRKTAVITGSSGRIGAEIVSALHGEGFDVIIHCYQSKQKSEQLCASLNKKRSNSAYVLAADLAKSDEIKCFSEAILNIFTHIDVLVNNASVFYPTPLAAVNENTWHNVMNVNALAPLLLSQALSKYVTNCVINLADIYGIKPLKDYTIYSTSKAALLMGTRSLALELAPDIRVNAICPGAILWHKNSDTVAKQNIIENVPLKKMGTTTDITQAVLFLVNAGYITGQAINIDGGRSLNQ